MPRLFRDKYDDQTIGVGEINATGANGSCPKTKTRLADSCTGGRRPVFET
jgi:hypothetical protein